MAESDSVEVEEEERGAQKMECCMRRTVRRARLEDGMQAVGAPGVEEGSVRRLHG